MSQSVSQSATKIEKLKRFLEIIFEMHTLDKKILADQRFLVKVWLSAVQPQSGSQSLVSQSWKAVWHDIKKCSCTAAVPGKAEVGSPDSDPKPLVACNPYHAAMQSIWIEHQKFRLRLQPQPNPIAFAHGDYKHCLGCKQHPPASACPCNSSSFFSFACLSSSSFKRTSSIDNPSVDNPSVNAAWPSEKLISLSHSQSESDSTNWCNAVNILNLISRGAKASHTRKSIPTCVCIIDI